jgi:predicted DNA-binding transcriptional regulator YafY
MARGESLIRQWNLLKRIQARRFGVGTEELAQELECSKRQVQRDLNVLQQVGFPIHFEERDFGKRFWMLAASFHDREELMLSVTEMLSLYLAQQLLAPLSGTQFGDALGTALGKFKAMLPKRTLAYFADLDETLLVKNIAQHEYHGQEKEIRILNQAVSEGRGLRIRYRSASKGKVTDARYHPYGLIFFGTNLYVVGYHVEYGEVRTLKVSRLQGVELMRDRFERPADFSLKAYLDGSFGIFSPGKLQSVKVRFTGWAATNVREHRWHPSQKIVKDSTDPKGGECVIATFDLSNTTEFRRWLLGFGRHAIVLKPESLREELQAEFCAACMTYGQKHARLGLASSPKVVCRRKEAIHAARLGG